MNNTEITALAIQQASYHLADMIDGQEMTDSKLAEIVKNLQDLENINPPIDLLKTPEEQAQYTVQYQGALSQLQEAMEQSQSYQIEKARSYLNVKSTAYRMAAQDFYTKAAAFQLDAMQPYQDQFETLKMDSEILEGKTELFKKLYKASYNDLLLNIIKPLAFDCAKKAATHDCNEQSGDAYAQLVEREEGFFEFLKPFRQEYESIVIAKAKEDAIAAAEHMAKEDYENANEKLHATIEQAFPNMVGNSPYENAFRAEYMSQYKILYNRHQVENGDHNKDKQLKELMDEIDKIGKEPEKKSIFSRIRRKDSNTARKIKLPKFGKERLKKFKNYGVHQLFDIEDVPGSLSLVALHNPYRENYYSPEERQRCHDILVAYEDILKLLELSNYRERDGSRSYLSIDDVLNVKGITAQQQEKLEQAKKDCVMLEMQAHKAKTADELTGKIAEVEELMVTIMKEVQLIQEATMALKDYEEQRMKMVEGPELSEETKKSAYSVSLMLTQAIANRDVAFIKERMNLCQSYLGVMEKEIEMAEVKTDTQEVSVETEHTQSDAVITEEVEPVVTEEKDQEALEETLSQPENTIAEKETTEMSLEQRVTELENELKTVKVERDKYFNKFQALSNKEGKKNIAYEKMKSELERRSKSLRSAKASKRRVESELKKAIKEKNEATSALEELSKVIIEMKENQEKMIREAVREAQKELLNNVQTDIKTKAEVDAYDAEADFLEGYRTFNSYTPEQLEYFVQNGGAQEMKEQIEKLPHLGSSEPLKQEFLRKLHQLQYETNLSGVQMVKK